ncbi:hypothetical protein COBT_003254 [Conglomerata obtusa]
MFLICFFTAFLLENIFRFVTTSIAVEKENCEDGHDAKYLQELEIDANQDESAKLIDLNKTGIYSENTNEHVNYNKLKERFGVSVNHDENNISIEPIKQENNQKNKQEFFESNVKLTEDEKICEYIDLKNKSTCDQEFPKLQSESDMKNSSLLYSKSESNVKDSSLQNSKPEFLIKNHQQTSNYNFYPKENETSLQSNDLKEHLAYNQELSTSMLINNKNQTTVKDPVEVDHLINVQDVNTVSTKNTVLENFSNQIINYIETLLNKIKYINNDIKTHTIVVGKSAAKPNAIFNVFNLIDKLHDDIHSKMRALKVYLVCLKDSNFYSLNNKVIDDKLHEFNEIKNDFGSYYLNFLTKKLDFLETNVHNLFGNENDVDNNTGNMNEKYDMTEQKTTSYIISEQNNPENDSSCTSDHSLSHMEDNESNINYAEDTNSDDQEEDCLILKSNNAQKKPDRIDEKLKKKQEICYRHYINEKTDFYSNDMFDIQAIIGLDSFESFGHSEIKIKEKRVYVNRNSDDLNVFLVECLKRKLKITIVHYKKIFHNNFLRPLLHLLINYLNFFKIGNLVEIVPFDLPVLFNLSKNICYIARKKRLCDNDFDEKNIQYIYKNGENQCEFINHKNRYEHFFVKTFYRNYFVCTNKKELFVVVLKDLDIL